MNIVIVAGVLITVLTCLPVLWQLRGHPRGLYVLFFAEMWERFSFYGMRALLVLYLTKHFLFSDRLAGAHYGAYQSLAYLLPLVGGILADRYLGARKAVAFGALLLVAGQLTMAVQGDAAQQVLSFHGAHYVFENQAHGGPPLLMVGGHGYAYGAAPDGGLAVSGLPASSPLPSVLPKGSYALSVEHQSPLYLNFMYFALATIIMGIGFLKANISSIVGLLYTKADPRRDAGFTLYYFGINLGSFWASVLCGYLGETVGWWAGFGLAGLGMLAGFVAFVIGRGWLEGRAEPPNPQLLEKRIAGPITREWVIYAGGLLGIGIVFFLVRHNALVGWMLAAGSAAILAYVGRYMVREADRVERQRLMLALVLVLGSIVFWTLFEQAGSSLQIFADRNVDLRLIHRPFTVPLFGRELYFGTRDMLAAAAPSANRLWIDMSLSSSQTQAFNPGFILMFAPVFAGLWAWLGRRGGDPSPMVKFGLALLQVGAGFLLLVVGARYADASFRTPLLFIGASYLLQTTGELCLSPVGMSQTTKLSPAILVSTMMAVWFLGISWAEWLGGLVAQFAGTDTVAGQVLDPGRALATSAKVFGWVGVFAAGVGVVFLVGSRWLDGWAHAVREGPHVAPEPMAPTLDGERQAVNPALMRAERDS